MLWIIIILIALVVIGGLLFIAPYNNFVRLRNLIQESWHQIDVELNRRYELIPNLVETVRAYAAHERNTLEEVTRLRNQAAAISSQQGGGMPSAQRAEIEGALSGAVRNLIVSVEAYPDLKSNQNFLELQRELTDTEDRIAAGRRFYNANVRAYNTKVEQVPSSIVASMFKFEKATYFEVTDPAVRQAPDVNFGEISYRGDQPQQQAAPGGQLGATASNELPNPQAQQWQTQAPQAQQWQTQAPQAQPVQAQPVQAQPVQAQPVQAQPVQAQPAQDQWQQPAQQPPAQQPPAQQPPVEQPPGGGYQPPQQG